MLEGYFDLIMVFIGYFMAFMLGEHFGEVRGNYHYYLEEIIKRSSRKLAPPLPPIQKVSVAPGSPLPAFKEEEYREKVKIDDYLGG